MSSRLIRFLAALASVRHPTKVQKKLTVFMSLPTLHEILEMTYLVVLGQRFELIPLLEPKGPSSH